MKVVFDTNIYVSAFLLPGSQVDSALMRIVEGTDRPIISKVIVDELLGVLSRKFAKDADALARVAVFLSDLAVSLSGAQELAGADLATGHLSKCQLSHGESLEDTPPQNLEQE